MLQASKKNIFRPKELEVHPAVTMNITEGYHLLGYDAVYSIEFQPTFRRNISPQATCLLAGFSEPISSTLTMEAICSSETSI
jgi:hypothetical protein